MRRGVYGVGVTEVDALVTTLRWGEGSGISMDDIWSVSGMHKLEKGMGMESVRMMSRQPSEATIPLLHQQKPTTFMWAK